MSHRGIYKKACKSRNLKSLCEDSQWRDFPAPDFPEKDLCPVFTKIANFVTKECLKGKPDVRWLSDPLRGPTLADVSAAEMKTRHFFSSRIPCVSTDEKRHGSLALHSHPGGEVKKLYVQSAAALHVYVKFPMSLSTSAIFLAPCWRGATSPFTRSMEWVCRLWGIWHEWSEYNPSHYYLRTI